VARALTAIVSLALAALVVAITALVTTRAEVAVPSRAARSAPPGGGESPAPAAPPLGRESPAPAAPPLGRESPAPAATVSKADAPAGSGAGRRLSVDEAMRELDLFKPPRARMAEDFTLPTPDGRPFRLSDHRGRVVLINFWATWCPPCREEMPSMERLYARQRDRRFTLVAVSLDSNPALVVPYFKQSGLSFPVVLDPRMDLANSYGVRALPASFIVDPRGTLVAVALGPRAWDGPAAHALVEGVAR
jgi:peroxiredoxin